MRAWPAAKYLTYCFWRSWILVVYTAPIWSYVANDRVRIVLVLHVCLVDRCIRAGRGSVGVVP